MKRIRSTSRNGGAPQRVLVISPHPDDESFGCGGTIREHVTQGASVRVVFLTSGEKGGHGRNVDETIRIRESEARAAAKILGVDAIEFWREPDGSLRSNNGIVGRLRDALREWRPHLVYVPHAREMHPDHRAACRLVRRALRDGFPPAHPPTLLEDEVWTPLQRPSVRTEASAP